MIYNTHTIIQTRTTHTTCNTHHAHTIHTPSSKHTPHIEPHNTHVCNTHVPHHIQPHDTHTTHTQYTHHTFNHTTHTYTIHHPRNTSHTPRSHTRLTHHTLSSPPAHPGAPQLRCCPGHTWAGGKVKVIPGAPRPGGCRERRSGGAGTVARQSEASHHSGGQTSPAAGRQRGGHMRWKQ